MTPGEKCAVAEQLLCEARELLETALASECGEARGALNQELWTALRMLGEVPEYFSQAGQDRYVDRLLSGGKRGGVFVDVGGYDGITGSNTLFFEVFRGWSGLLVEPAPDRLAQARARRRCRCVGDAVAGAPGSREFLHVLAGFTQMSGLLESYDPRLLSRVRANPAHQERIVAVQARPLAQLLREAGLARIDYLSLDVEGAEGEILAGFPFDEFEIAACSIENPDGSPEIGRSLEAAGYELVEYLGVDEIYARHG